MKQKRKKIEKRVILLSTKKMIIIKINQIKQTGKQNYQIKKITITGHSNQFSLQQLDPLCLAVSTVSLGITNSFYQQFHHLLPLLKITKKEDGYLQLEALQPNKEITTIFTMMLVQLQTVASYFKKGIKILYFQKNKK